MVERGRVIGKLGNSGNSSEPHLHLDIVDNPSFIGANSLPYAFDRFYLRPSKLLQTDPVFKVEITPDRLQSMTNQLMLENAVVKFADQ